MYTLSTLRISNTHKSQHCDLHEAAEPLQNSDQVHAMMAWMQIHAFQYKGGTLGDILDQTNMNEDHFTTSEISNKAIKLRDKANMDTN